MTRPAQVRAQLEQQRRKVDFDSYDVTVDELLRRVARGRIDIAPIYQRQFRWDAERQSRLIESVLLGIPVPPLFMATNTTTDIGSAWEVVDGLQRLLSLVNFAGDIEARTATHLDSAPLRLKNLEKLTEFEGFRFSDLPSDIARGFEDRPIKVIVLNDKSDLQVRYDLFERLNTGGVALSPQEIRQSVYRGSFINLIGELARSVAFNQVLVLPETRMKDGTPEDFVLRFFAFLARYQQFDHSVQDFLNDFAAQMTGYEQPPLDTFIFTETFRFLAECFPSGLKSRKGQTPVNLFEAVSVGAALALQASNGKLHSREPTWVGDDELRELTTGATNSRRRVTGRIEYCRDRFLQDG